MKRGVKVFLLLVALAVITLSAVSVAEAGHVDRVGNIVYYYDDYGNIFAFNVMPSLDMYGLMDPVVTPLYVIPNDRCHHRRGHDYWDDADSEEILFDFLFGGFPPCAWE
jgi:hypothetical protein